MNPWLDGHVDHWYSPDAPAYEYSRITRWDEFPEDCRIPWREQQAFDLVNNIGPGVDEFTDWEKD